MRETQRNIFVKDREHCPRTRHNVAGCESKVKKGGEKGICACVAKSGRKRKRIYVCAAHKKKMRKKNESSLSLVGCILLLSPTTISLEVLWVWFSFGFVILNPSDLKHDGSSRACISQARSSGNYVYKRAAPIHGFCRWLWWFFFHLCTYIF